MSPRQCLTDGCLYPAVPGRSRCKECGGASWAWSKPMGAGWASIRAGHLRREPNCRVCGSQATTVDHRLARAFGGGDEESNLQSLCRVHAAQKDHEDRELGKKLKRERGGRR